MNKKQSPMVIKFKKKRKKSCKYGERKSYASQITVQMNKKYDRNVSFNHTQDFIELGIMQE